MVLLLHPDHVDDVAVTTELVYLLDGCHHLLPLTILKCPTELLDWLYGKRLLPLRYQLRDFFILELEPLKIGPSVFKVFLRHIDGDAR